MTAAIQSMKVDAIGNLIVGIHAGSIEEMPRGTGFSTTEMAMLLAGARGSIDAVNKLAESLMPGDLVLMSSNTGTAQAVDATADHPGQFTGYAPGREANARLIAVLSAYRRRIAG